MVNLFTISHTMCTSGLPVFRVTDLYDANRPTSGLRSSVETIVWSLSKSDVLSQLSAGDI